MSEIKMSDVFNLPMYRYEDRLFCQGVAGLTDPVKPMIMFSIAGVYSGDSHSALEHVKIAINSYDSLVEENNRLREALSEVIDGQDKYDLAGMTGCSVERCEEIKKLTLGGIAYDQ